MDCSATSRYLEVNRNNYQIDDDEMIRNAYAMISLQSSTEDVTKDGLVDPDSGARIIDYSVLGGRTVTSYTPVSFRRITDYPAVDTTGNDLPSGFEDYRQEDNRQILNYNRRFQQKSTNPTYQNKFHLEGKGRSPYHAAAIIRQDYQDQSGSNEQFQDDYRGPDGFNNQLQTSYAPTVPTVTTTTRRFYSPTVPTTYRPSTLAYSKLDLIMDSSDHLYAHSKNAPATPSTISHRDDDEKNADLRESETRHEDGPKTSGNVRDNQNDDVARSKNDEVHGLNFEEKKSETSFRINLTAIDEDEVFRQQNDRPVIRNDYDESRLEDIETRDSIGIARALNDPDGINVQNQNPVEETLKNERRGLSSSSQAGRSSSVDNLSQTSKNIFNETSDDRQSTEDYEDVTSVSTTRIYEEKTSFTRNFGHRTTPLLKNWRQKDVDTVQASTFSVTAKPTRSTIESDVDQIDHFSSNDNQTNEDENSSLNKPISSFNDESVSRIHLDFEVPQPAWFLRPPPAESFLINVPEEETRYATTDQNSKTTTWSPEATTELPQFSVTPNVENIQSPANNANVEEQSIVDYVNEKLSEATNLEVNPTAQATPKISTPIPWLVSSSWRDRSIVDPPATDIVPPSFASQSDRFDDPLVPPKTEESAWIDRTERARDAQNSARNSSATSSKKKTNAEEPILIRYDMGFHLSIRDAIKAQEEARTIVRTPLCRSSASDKQDGTCETSSVTPKTNSVASSTASVEEKTVSIGTKATTRFPEQLTFSASSRLPEKSVTIVRNEFSTFTTPLPVITVSTGNINAERSTLKTIASRNVPQSNRQNLEEKAKETVTESASPLRSTRPPGFLKQAVDKHGSPYEVSLTIEKDEDPDRTVGDDIIGRLVAQQSAPASKKPLDFEIIKSIETKDKIVIPQISFPDTVHELPNGENIGAPVNDTIYDLPGESDVSMLSLVQLMAELLRLDRLPRPFSMKDFHSADLTDDSFDLDLDEPSSFVTASPLTSDRHSQFKTTTFGNARTANFHTSKISASTAKPRVSLNSDRNEPSFVTANPPLDHSQQTKVPFGNANFKSSNFDIPKTPRVVKSKTRPNHQNNPSFDTTKNSPSFDDTSNTFKISLKSSPDDSSKTNSNTATEPKAIQSKSENRTVRPFQKEEILDQLAENFGQPFYRDDSIHRSLVFDLPQVQRNLDFESGLPLDEDKSSDEESAIFSTARTPTTTQEQIITTTESVRTVVETEFVPSLGFSFDTNEGREEYVQAVLKGLIDERNGEGDKKNESREDVDVALSPDEAPKTDTSKLESTKNV